MRHRPATGTGRVNFCRCDRYTNESNGTGTGPERDRNGTRARTGTGVNTAIMNKLMSHSNRLIGHCLHQQVMSTTEQHLVKIIQIVPSRTKAVFTPQLWDRNGSGTQPGARVHTCSTASGRSRTSRPPRDVIAVERFRNGSGWLCGVNARLDPFRNRSGTVPAARDIRRFPAHSSYYLQTFITSWHLATDRLIGDKSRYSD